MFNQIKSIGLFFSLGLLLTAWTPSGFQKGDIKNRIKIDCLDAGHGGKDPGCSGPKGSHEGIVTLHIIQELGRKLKAAHPDLKIIYTRDTDTFIELNERANIANRNKADLFISVHCNAAVNKNAYGTETYTMGLHKTDGNLNVAKRENSVILHAR